VNWCGNVSVFYMSVTCLFLHKTSPLSELMRQCKFSISSVTYILFSISSVTYILFSISSVTYILFSFSSVTYILISTLYRGNVSLSTSDRLEFSAEMPVGLTNTNSRTNRLRLAPDRQRLLWVRACRLRSHWRRCWRSRHHIYKFIFNKISLFP
jgi:hypothetical protein